MHTRTMTMPSGRPSAAAPCGCGGECHGTCCALDGLVRPRFFCGQLLTDQDLMTLVGWARDKLALGRFRHGWGVVCGLDVHCDPECPAGVVVDPGYAVSCCGDDIVVSKDRPLAERCLDLTPCCRQESDPCEDPYASKSESADETSEARLLRGGSLEALFPTGDRADLRIVDVALRYRERDDDPQEALAHDACGQQGVCVDSRTHEEFHLVARAVAADNDPMAAAAARWERGYDECLRVLTDFQAAFTSGYELEADAVRRWLLDRLARQPSRHFCFLHESICQLDDDACADEQVIAKLLFLFVLECRHAYLTCDCYDCDEDHGVPLARVWLRSSVQDGGRCRVLAVDASPPVRRPLGPTCWPACLGEINVGQVIGHRWEEACTRLADLGIRPARTVGFDVPPTVAALSSALTCRPFVSCGAAPVVQVANLGHELGQRVVGFCGLNGSTDEPVEQEAPTYDDLTDIARLGPRSAEVLQREGVTSYGHLARASVEQLQELLPRTAPDVLEHWIEEAARRVGGGHD